LGISERCRYTEKTIIKTEVAVKNNKHAEFIKSIRLSTAESEPKKLVQGEQNTESYRMSRQEEYDFQKELERRFDKLFETTEED
jgi:hypothetical protein